MPEFRHPPIAKSCRAHFLTLYKSSVSHKMHPLSPSLQPFYDMIDGMRMDLVKPRYENFDELYEYCYRVAGTVALMSVPIMGICPNYKGSVVRQDSMQFVQLRVVTSSLLWGLVTTPAGTGSIRYPPTVVALLRASIRAGDGVPRGARARAGQSADEHSA